MYVCLVFGFGANGREDNYHSIKWTVSCVCAKICLLHSAFSMLLQNHMLHTSFMQFQDKNCRIRVSEAGY
jgi:hypothetical protein